MSDTKPDEAATGADVSVEAVDGGDETDVAALAAESDPVLEHTAEGRTYAIRRFRPADKPGFLALHDEIESLRFGGSSAWFDWKFDDPPALVHVPVFLATHDDQVVGARPFVPFRLRAGPRTLVGLQTADTMVHPDHRGRGLFSRMNDLAFAYYRQREPEVMFSVPNSRSRPAYLDVGARVVGPVPFHHRLESPSTYVTEKFGSRVPSRTGSVLDGLATGYLGVRDRWRNGFAPDDVTVERHAGVPAATFAALADSAVPETIHACRDEPFYEWRFANPTWEYDSYVASRDGDRIAGTITATRTVDGQRVTRITEVAPLRGEQRLPGVAATFERLLDSHPDTDVFTVAGRGLPTSLLRAFGFHSDGSLPLSPVTDRTVMIAMPLSGDDWRVENRSLTDPANWDLPFAEQNTS